MQQKELTQHERELIKAIRGQRDQILEDLALLKRLRASAADINRLLEQLEDCKRRLALAESALKLGAEHGQ